MKPVSALDIEKSIEGKPVSLVVHKCSRKEKSTVEKGRKKGGKKRKRVRGEGDRGSLQANCLY